MAIFDDPVSGVIKADGTGTLTWQPIGQVKELQQVSHTGSVPGGISVGASATCILYKNGRFITRTIASGGTIDGLPYIPARTGDTFTLKYVGATVGAAIEATFIYDNGLPG